MITCLVFLLSFVPLINSLEPIKLPGAPESDSIQYAGYLSFRTNQNAHFVFSLASNNSIEAPIILYSFGDLGCSNLWPLLQTLGPFSVINDSEHPILNPNSWTKEMNVLVIDIIGGTGYAYPFDIYPINRAEMAKRLKETLIKFFELFPDYKRNDFYIAGTSSGASYIVQLAAEQTNKEKDFNLKGIMLGNPRFDWSNELLANMLYYYTHGFVDYKLYDFLVRNCCKTAIENCSMSDFFQYEECGAALSNAVYNSLFSGINPINIYDECEKIEAEQDTSSITRRKFETLKAINVNERFQLSDCINDIAIHQYLNRRDVRTALGVPSNISEWQRCRRLRYELSLEDARPLILQIINAGIRILFYGGDADAKYSFIHSKIFADRLGFNVTKENAPYYLDDQVAGYRSHYPQHEFATILGGGRGGYNKHKETLHLITSFVKNLPEEY